MHIAAMSSSQENWFEDGAYGTVSLLPAHGIAYTFIGRRRAYGPKKRLTRSMRNSGGGSALPATVREQQKLRAPRTVSSGRLRKLVTMISPGQQHWKGLEKHPRHTARTLLTEKPDQREDVIRYRQMPRCC